MAFDGSGELRDPAFSDSTLQVINWAEQFQSPKNVLWSRVFEIAHTPGVELVDAVPFVWDGGEPQLYGYTLKMYFFMPDKSLVWFWLGVERLSGSGILEFSLPAGLVFLRRENHRPRTEQRQALGHISIVSTAGKSRN